MKFNEIEIKRMCIENGFIYAEIDLKKYCYMILDDYEIVLKDCKLPNHTSEYIDTSECGLLTIKSGYAWNGCTGVYDFSNTIEASLVHDALYQLIQEGVKIKRKNADKVFYMLMKSNSKGMFDRCVSRVYYRGVRIFGGIFAK